MSKPKNAKVVNNVRDRMRVAAKKSGLSMSAIAMKKWGTENQAAAGP